MEMFRRENKINEKKASAATNIFRGAISDLKLGAAAVHFETLLSLLSCCSVDVGNIGHSRKNFKDILYCLEKTVNRKINTWLNQPLPLTQLPPHIWATVAKATPSRTTNQAVLVVARKVFRVQFPLLLQMCTRISKKPRMICLRHNCMRLSKKIFPKTWFPDCVAVALQQMALTWQVVFEENCWRF